MYAKINCYKADFDNNQYPLKNCEITLYTENNGVYTIARDLNGNNCVGETDSNGRCTFMVQDTDFDTGGTIHYYAEETRAPFGYKKIVGKRAVRPTPNQNDAIVTPMTMVMFDKIIVVPPKTGGWNECLLNPYTGNPIANIWWAGNSNSPSYFDRVEWFYYDDTGHATTESGTYLPGRIIHPTQAASVLITDVNLTWVDERDNVTRTVSAGSPVEFNYRDIFNV